MRHLGVIQVCVTAAALQLLPAYSACASDTGAVSERKTYTTLGLRSCNKWLEDEKYAKTASPNSFNSLNFIGDQSWLAGFISGFNVVVSDRQDLLGTMDLQTASDWVSLYCYKNRNATVPDAVVALFYDLAKR
jgi:hypothetical protein